MKELFERYRAKLRDDEDRQVWAAMHDAAQKKKSGRRGWVPASVIGAAAAAVLAIAVVQNTERSAVRVALDEAIPGGSLAPQSGQIEKAPDTDFSLPPVALRSGEREESKVGDEVRLDGNVRSQAAADARRGRPADVAVVQERETGKKSDDGSLDLQKNTTWKEKDALRLQAEHRRNEERARRQSQPERMQAVPYLEGTPPTPAPTPKPAPAREAESDKKEDPTWGGVTTTSEKPQPPVDWQMNNVGGTDPVNGADYDAMFYRDARTNPFIDPRQDPFATFAMDVDNASYSLARSYLERNTLPPAEAIRVEEFINAFDHDYAPPQSTLIASRRWASSEHGTFAIHLDAAPSPFGNDHILLRVGLKGKEIADHQRKPATLTFVIDVSGSMNRENRLELVKRSLFLLLDKMNNEDEVALVVYGSNAHTVLPVTSLQNRTQIERAIASLGAGGSTYAEAGLREAYAMAQRNFRRERINRVLLCSDGVANVGETGADGILDVIKREASRGIYLTTIGFGMGNYNDVLMERLADEGNGNYYYVDDITEARRVLVENLTGTLQVIARESKIQVEFEPDIVRSYRLLGYENRDLADRDFRNDSVDAGEVGAGHEVTALFEINLEKESARGTMAVVRIRYEDPETGRITEERREVAVGDVKRDLSETDPTFRMDATVAEFAEILRDSYWAAEGDLSRVREMAAEVSEEMDSPEQLRELIRLIETAQRLTPRKETTPWRPAIESDQRNR